MKRLTEIPPFIEIEVGGIVLIVYGTWIKGDDDDRGFYNPDKVILPVGAEELDVTELIEAFQGFDVINEVLDVETLTWELEDD